jgi:cytochrome c-type biogenesis protein
MNDLLAAGASALWLGILTSISPCPLASNVAAVAYVGQQVGSSRRVLLSGLLYSLGRALTYVAVGALVVASLLSIPSVSWFLQRRMNQVLGPILILIGLVVLVRLPFRWSAGAWSDSLRRRAAGVGILGPVLLGVLFALSFCPVSAGLFFGGLIPLATASGSRVLVPAVYGLGTGLPVVLFAVLLAMGVRGVAGVFQALTSFERVARVLTGVIFVGSGLYLTVTHLLLP